VLPLEQTKTEHHKQSKELKTKDHLTTDGTIIGLKTAFLGHFFTTHPSKSEFVVGRGTIENV